MMAILQNVITRIICFFFGIIISIQYSQAQESDRKVKFGVMVGANYAQVNLSKSNLPQGIEFQKNNKISPAFGLRANFNLSNSFAIQSGLTIQNYSYQITQTSFGTDSLSGFVETRNDIQSWEIPLILSYKIPVNNFFSNFHIAGGAGLALDHYTRFRNRVHLDVVFPQQPPGSLYFYSTEVFDGLSQSGNTFSPSLIAGIGTDINISSKKSLQLNVWYAQGFKYQAQYDIKYIHQKKYIYPMEIKALVSSFRFEVIYFPWKL